MMKRATIDKKFYEEFRWSRSIGSNVMEAYRWACGMRACGYVLFLD